MKRAVILFVAIFVLHSVAQFMAWAAADAIHPSGFSQIAWAILGFPGNMLFMNIANADFAVAMAANSLIWAAFATFIVASALRLRGSKV